MAELSQIRVSGTLYDIKDAVARMATGSPAVAATASAMIDRGKVYVYTGSESGYTNGNWYYYDGSSWVSGGVYNSAAVETDTSLSVSGAPADAKVTGDSIKYIVSVGDTPPSQHTQLLFSESTTELDLVTTETFNNEITDLKSAIAQGGGFNAEVKQALLAMFRKCMMFDGGDDAYDDLYNSLYPPIGLDSISAVYTQTGTVYDTDSLDDLKSDLVVTARWSDSSTTTLSDSAYVLSGQLSEGTSTITVSYGGKTDTFVVTVTASREVIDFTNRAYTDAHALNNQGNWVSYTGWQTFDDSISVEGFTKVSYSLLASYQYNNLYINGISFFDSSDTFLEAIDVAHCETAELIKTAPASGYKLRGESNIPAQASYMKVTRWEDTNAGMVLVPNITLII